MSQPSVNVNVPEVSWSFVAQNPVLIYYSKIVAWATLMDGQFLHYEVIIKPDEIVGAEVAS